MPTPRAIPTGIRIGFSVALLALVFGAVVADLNSQVLTSRTKRLLQTEGVLRNLSTLRSGLTAAEAAVGGLLLTDDAKYIAPYEAGVAEARRALQEVTTQTADNPVQARASAMLRPSVEAKLQVMASTLASYRAQGPSAARDQVRTGAGKELMDRVCQQVEQMEKEEIGFLPAPAQGWWEQVFIFERMSWGGSILLLLMIVVAARMVQRDARIRDRDQALLIERSRQLELSAAVGNALTNSEPLQAQLQHCAEAVVRRLNAAFARIWTLDPGEDFLVLQASAGLYTHLNGPHGRVPVGSLKIGLIAQERVPHLTNDVRTDSRIGDHAWAEREGMVSFAGYPLLSQGRLCGVLALFAKQPLTLDALQALSGIADQVAVAIDKARAESALKRHADDIQVSNEWFQTTLTSIGDAVIATDREGRITFMNTVAQSLTQWRGEEGRGRPLGEVFKIVHEHSREPAESPVERVIRDGETVGLANNTVLTGRHGTEVAIDDSAAPIRNARGELDGVVLVFRDVTEKRREEDQRKFLIEAGQLLASSLDSSKTLNAVAQLAVPKIADWCSVELGADPGTSEQAAVAHINPAKLQFSLDLNARYPPDRHAATGIPQVLRTGKPQFATELPAARMEAVAQDAEHLRLIQALNVKSYMIVPLGTHGKVLGAISFISTESGRRYGPKDVAFAESLANLAALAIENARLHTEETNARAQAELAEQSHRSLAESIPTIVWRAGPDGINNYFNRRWYEYTGMTAGVVDPKAWVKICHPDDIARLSATWAGCLEQGTAFESEYRLLRASDSSYRWHLARSMPLKDGNGRVAQWFGTSTDIEEQKRAQEEQRKRIEFEQHLIGIVSHDLRNPISAVSMSASLLLGRGGLDADQNKAVERILAAMDRAHRLIRDLLDLSQARRGGGIPIQPQPHDLHEIARAVVEEVQLAHPERRIQLISTGLGSGEWDPDRLAQIITNLTVNAATYSAPNVPVAVRTLGNDSNVVLEIHNRGEPIPPDLLPVLFEPFKRGRDPEGPSRGVGLGLFIVEQLVRAHSGSIQVASNADDGTTVRVVLPRVSASSGKYTRTA